MSDCDPIALLFGGMEKLAPGDDEHTRCILHSLPRKVSGTVVDAGCGTGRQTLVLAKELKTKIHALDNYQLFLDDLLLRAKQTGLEQLIETHCSDMAEIPQLFPAIDLLWSEG